mmetsp:Transcript_40311/g.82480  ORF Transcript_40311/g.82480 Transcript_40311/m.82480 type:complete len:433 (+) Transcript_40311:115-1413(+)|eukprot:CAMPEP_0181300792 /NCGR_PEP_ID=MMETSP1101-20121128/7077_1 /TAXON_ID=46948 /ORGANISM="Rhodomonas abbreviata, Strain Caron Lab Isolate" /LENGTH=432 /DNA_ID=CAMNT_0023406049 /DNA_START=115 /DNA_END=1413 /DNA_ORIENTATION=-
MRIDQGYGRVLVIAINFLLGCGLLTPWNSLITAVDFFSALFPDNDPADAFAIANFAANLLFLLLQVVWVQKESAVKASFCFVLSLGVLGYSLFLALAFHDPFQANLDRGVSESIHFMVLVGCVAISGAACSGLQPALFSVAGELGPACTAAFMNGQAFAGILTCVCRILSKVWFRESEPFEALRLSSALYLSSSLAVVCLAFIAYFALLRLRKQQQGPAQYAHGITRDDPLNAFEAESLLHDEEAAGFKQSEHAEDVGIAAVWRQMWSSGCGVLVVFWITLSVFPAVTSRIPAAQSDPDEWMPVVLITAFNIGDLLGRMLAGLLATSLSELTLWALNVARIAFIPLLLYLQQSPSTGGGAPTHNAVAIASVLLMAASSGFLACAFIIKGQLRVSGGAAREAASTLLALTMTTGLALGAVSALPITQLGSKLV